MKIRTRLAVTLAACLLVAGSVALFVSEAATENSIPSDFSRFQSELIAQTGASPTVIEQYLRQHPETIVNFDSNARVLPHHRSLNDIFRAILKRSQTNAVDHSRRIAFLALAGLVLVAGIVGWLIARRVLRPAHMIAERARTASANDLTQRVSLGGPDDEMKELSDTFDDMLDRLERSFVAQRRFAAQISHELRTPLTVIRAESELLDDQTVLDTQRQAVGTIRRAAEHSQHLIDALLAMSRSESGNLDMRKVALDEIVGDALTKAAESGTFNQVRVDAEVTATEVRGDRGLLDCVAFNLVDNAARHNLPGGWMRVTVRPDPDGQGWGLLNIANSTSPDPRMPGWADERPVQASNRSGNSRGHGIGLTVVRSVIDAHAGRVDLATTEDAATVTVRIPAFEPEGRSSPSAPTATDSPLLG